MCVFPFFFQVSLSMVSGENLHMTLPECAYVCMPAYVCVCVCVEVCATSCLVLFCAENLSIIFSKLYYSFSA